MTRRHLTLTLTLALAAASLLAACGKSLSAIFLPDIAEDATLSQGYTGHDEFAIVENSLARRFPIYAAGDSNAAPSGKMRQVSYGLVAGEAGWLLRMRDVTEF